MPNGLARRLPELLLGLVAVTVGLVVTGFVVADAVRDVKRARDTIRVTGSAREPIDADLARWSLAVNAQSVRPQDAVRLLNKRVRAVRAFLSDGGLPASAINEPPVVTQQTTIRLASKRRVAAFRLVQRFRISSPQIDQVERVAAAVSDLLTQGVPVSAGGISYISTNLTQARLNALKKAIADAHRRAETIVQGIGGDLGAVRSAELGVYQVVPRNSTEVSDYGINDTTSREKDVYAVVSVTFRVH
ncbi:MAG TPA: SIMPL domain-containing protein [Gaiellaceae bacterium]|nr:SIMPL domain-containing protein [Gaiellaceae bacterium]